MPGVLHCGEHQRLGRVVAGMMDFSTGGNPMHLLLCLAALLADPQAFVVEGQGVGRAVVVDGGRIRSESIRNATTGREVRVQGPEFVITYGEGAVASSDEFDAVDAQARPGALECVAVNGVLGLRATIRYSRADTGPYLYKQITFENTGVSPFLLRAVELEHLSVTDESITYTVDPAFPSLGDWGQPVYTESLWFGVEFPAARSAATKDGVIILRHHPGVELQPGASYITKRAMIGAAPAGAVQHAFFDYVRTITRWPNPPRANIYWNGFRVVKPPDRLPQGIAMIAYANQLKESTGFTFDGWSYDAGFDMYRPDALFVPNEPDIWDKTREALKPIDTPLGFWTSFSPIFDTPTHAWGRTQDFELQHDAAYCLAGPVYFAAIKKRIEDIVRTHGMNTINFDGMYWGQGFGCNQPGHGHLVGVGAEAGVYATERVAENKIAIFESLRAINPKIVLDLFVCNEWASPWWLAQLDGVHTVAGDTLGCDIPSPWLRDELITVRDIQVFDEHRRLRRQFPLWAEDLYGNQVRRDHLIDGVVVTGEDMAARWEDEFTLALAGRGPVQNHIVCSDLEVLAKSASGLDFLGRAGNWVRANAEIYSSFKLIGGEPAKRQPYGYTHGDGKGRSIVALRNPWIEPRNHELRIDDQLDLGIENEDVTVTVIYPYRETFAPVPFGSAIHVPLDDYTVMLLEVRTASRRITGAPEEGRWVSDASGTHMLDRSALNRLPEGRFVTTRATNAYNITGSVVIPDGATGQICVMLQPNQSLPELRATVNGAAVQPTIHHRQREKKEDAWALIDVTSGPHAVEIALAGNGGGTVGAWLVAHYTLPVKSTSSVRVEEELYPVFAADQARRIATLLQPTAYALPMPPLPEGAEISLGDLKSRCVASKVGFFHVGWNASCWDEQPTLRIGQNTYKKGIGVHAPSELVFNIGGAFARFSADVGMHGVPPERKAADKKTGTCAFVVEGDGKTLYTSPVLKEGDAPLHIDVEVNGVKHLTLRTTDGGDSNFDDLGTWANTTLRR